MCLLLVLSPLQDSELAEPPCVPALQAWHTFSLLIIVPAFAVMWSACVAARIPTQLVVIDPPCLMLTTQNGGCTQEAAMLCWASVFGAMPVSGKPRSIKSDMATQCTCPRKTVGCRPQRCMP